MKNKYAEKITAILAAVVFLLAASCVPALAGAAGSGTRGAAGGKSEQAEAPTFVDAELGNGGLVVRIPEGAQYVRIPEAATIVRDTVFKGNPTVKAVSFAGDTAGVAPAAFEGCTSLVQVNLPRGMTDIPEKLFSGCTALTSVAIPAGVTTIGADAFRGCTSLTGITLPAGLISIDKGAFADTSSLSAIEIPADVKSVGEGAFSGSGLRRLTFLGREEVYDSWENTGIDSTVELSFPEDPNFWNPAEDQDWLQSAYRYEDGVWAVLIHANPRRDCTITAGGPMLGKTPGYTIRGPQTQTVTAGGSTGNTFELVLSGKRGDKISVHITGFTGTARAAFEKVLDFTIPWDPANTSEWITVSDQNPRSGDTVLITATCPEASVSFILDAQPLAGSASFVQTAPAYGSVIVLNSAAAAQKTATIRAAVSGNKGDRIRLHVAGTFSAGDSNQSFSGELPDLVISQSAQSTPAPTPAPTPSATLPPAPTRTPVPTPSAAPTPTPVSSPSQPPDASQPPDPSPTISPEPTRVPPSVISLDPESGMEIGEDIFGKGVLFVDDGTRALQIEKAFEASQHAYAEFENAKGEPVAPGERVATGYKVVFRNVVTTQPVRELTIVVWGDAQGTGRITLTQLVITAGSYVGDRPLSGCYLMAVDFNRNFHINLSDLVHEAQLFLTRSDHALSSGTGR